MSDVDGQLPPASGEPEIRPFPGLRPFEAEEQHLFFGREGQSERVLEAMRRTRLLAVVGGSGSGKSSLIRAGLVPYLHGGFLRAAGANWRVAVIRPGADPIGALADAMVDEELLRPRPAAAEEVARDKALARASLRRGGRGLVDALAEARLPEGDSVLLVVDQFEELFRFGQAAGVGSADDAQAFAKLLIEAWRAPSGPLYVVLTMRSDFIGDCARFRDLPEAVTAGLYLVPRLTRAERRATIDGPARVAGGKVAPRLVARALNDVGDDPDQLPILQHAMMRTWDRWKSRGDASRPVDLEDYEAIGGAANALSMHADEAFEGLDPAGKAIAEKLFRALTERDAENREARRPTRLAALAESCGADLAATSAVVEAFRAPGRSFLTPAPPAPLGPDAVIDISHESLIRGWRRLRGWVEAEAESARVYRRLSETADLNAAGKAGLWRDPDLALALDWQAREAPTAAWAERYGGRFEAARAFLDRSATAARAETDAAAEAQHRRLRRLQGLFAGVAVTAIGFAGLGIYALRQKGAAEVALAKAQDSEKAQKASAQEARASADRAKASEASAKEALARARASERNALAIADDARRQELQNDVYVVSAANSALPTLPPAGQGFAHFLLANAYDSKGDESKFGREVEAWRKSGLAPDFALAQAAYAAVLRADAESVIADSTALLDKSPNPVTYGNLAIAHVMRGEYGLALAALAEAPKHYSPPLTGIGHDLAPDIKAITGKRSITPESSDILVALDYFRAAVLAMRGDPGFDGALKTADAAAGGPGSANAQLFALQMVWLAARGQALAENMGETGPNGRRLPTGWKDGRLVDYGVFAAQGAIWESAGRALGGLQPEYERAAARAYASFRAAYAAAPRADYAYLEAFARKRLADPALDSPADPPTRKDPRALALQAEEIKAETTGTSLFDVQPAIDRMGVAIEELRSRASAGTLGRRGEDLELSLLIERGQWLADAKDWKPALADADSALTLAPGSAEAHALRAQALPPRSPDRIAEDRKALELQPTNWRASFDLARLYASAFPTRALVYWERYRRVALVFPAASWREMAVVQFRLGKYADAKASVEAAFALDPGTTSYCADLRTIAGKLGATPDSALAGYSGCLAKSATVLDRAGKPGDAVATEVTALRALAGAGTPDAPDLAFERERAARAITSILSDRFGAPRAAAFWDETAKGSDSALKSAATAEAARLSAPPPSRP